MTGLVDYLKAYYRVCRLEYAPGEAPAILFPLILGAGALGDFFAPRVLEAMVIFVLLFFSGFIVNSMADRELDRKYQSFKGEISRGVDEFGERGMRLLLWSHVLTAVALTVHLSVMLSDPVPLVIVAVGLFFGLGYSAEPFHFKVKGWLHTLSLSLSAYFIPFLFLYYAMALTFEPLAVALILTFTITHYAIEFTNQAADAREDRMEGLRTPGVQWGVSRILGWARWGIFAGVSLMVVLMVTLFVTSGVPPFSGLADASALELLQAGAVLAAVVALIASGYSVPFRGATELRDISLLPEPEEVTSQMIKERIRFHDWQTTGVSGAFACIAMLFVLVSIAPVPSGDRGMSPGDLSGGGLSIDEVRYSQPYYLDGRLQVDATVILNGSTPDGAGVYTARCSTWYAGRPYHRVNVTFREGADRAVASLAVHDPEDTSFEFRLSLDGRTLGEPYETPSRDRAYIVSAELVEPRDLLDQYTLEVTVYNDRGTLEPGTLELTLDTNGLADPLTGEKTQSNGEGVAGGSFWKATFTLDRLGDVDEFELELRLDGEGLDDMVLSSDEL